jgi:class 3 adenylate cyclase/tetratricopeptide (TPR) repeat protein
MGKPFPLFLREGLIMTFDEILEQVLDILRRRGRVSYRALKRQFDLDDAYLADLQAEIVEVHRLAMDQDGTMLVWIGEPAPAIDQEQGAVSSTAPHTEPPPAPSTSQTTAPHGQLDDQTTPVTPPVGAPAAPDAERRQLTVMFCDLVDSTPLSRRLDPEDYRAVVRAYQAACAEVIHHFDGYIAQYLGDGLLVYFGYPLAHEDDAQRAIRAGLGAIAAVEALNPHLERDKGVRLAIRVGIHTGLVVVGEIGAAGRHEQLALGETPNVAARLQGLPAPNTVAISTASYHLVEGYFVCDDLGAHTFKGVDTPLQVYRIVGESGAQSRLDVASPRGLTPLVGREAEVTLLLDRWAQVTDGLGQVVLLSGEGGIGKSRLVQMLKDHLASEPHTLLECRCSPYHTHSALYPVIDLWQRVLRFETAEAPADKLHKLEQMLAQYRLPLVETVPLFAALLSLPAEQYPPLTLTPQQQKQKTLETCLALLVERAAQEPVLFIVEDLHWVDPSTLEFLNLLMDQGPTARILTLCTFRPQFTSPWPPRAHIAQLTLTRLPRSQIGRMVTAVAGGKALPAEVVQQIVTKSDGVPLFVEEMTKLVLASGLLQEHEDHYTLTGPLPPLAIPATLQDALMARLDQLASAKAVAQLGATLGREFAYELLRAVSPLDELELWRGLVQLVQAEVLYQRGALPQATYLFKHALLQEAAYQSLLKSTRQHYHQRIAEVLAAQFPETTATQPELLARHYTEASLQAQALPYWHQAGQRAMARSAYAEALQHLTTGLEVLATAPETPARHQHELDLLTAFARVLGITKSTAAPELEPVLTRAAALAQQVGEPSQRFAVLYALWTFRNVRVESQAAQAVAEQLLDLAQRQQDPALLLGAHHALGVTLGQLGAFALARTHHEQGIALYDSQRHATPHPGSVRNHGVSFRALVAHVLWALGYPDQAVKRSQEALAMAHALAHPYSMVEALRLSARLHAHRREWQTAQAYAEVLLALATEHGFARYAALGAFFRGWALAAQGQGAEGIAQMRQGLDASRATGAALDILEVLARLAEAYGQVGQVDEGLHLLAEALAMVGTRGGRRSDAELHRLHGELLLNAECGVRNAEVAAEECFQQALDVARRQQVKSYELRTAMSLSRLWQQQGKRAEARALLAEVYDWFTEGFDTADLQDAKALLEELA